MIHRPSEKGNALWFIMIAVVLLGLLTVISSRSGSSVDQSGDVEQLRLKAGQLMRTGKSLQMAVEKMGIQGIGENDISFQNSTTMVDYTNSKCSSNACLVFNVEGGAQTYQPAPAGANDGSEWIFTAANNVGSTDGPVGTTAANSGNDLLALLPGIPDALCKQINRELKITNTADAPPAETGVATTAFVGTYTGLVVVEGDPAPNELDKKNAGCFRDDASSKNYFYYVLLAR